MNNKESVFDGSLFNVICFIMLLLLPSQVVIANVSWAASDLLIPFSIILLLSEKKLKNVTIRKSVILLTSFFFFQLFFSLIYVFKDSFRTSFLSMSLICIFKIIICILYAAIYYIFFMGLNRKQYEFLLKLLFVISIGFATLCYIGVALYYLGIDNYFICNGYRACATYTDPNLTAVYLLLSIGYSMFYIFYNQKYKARICSFALIYIIIGVFLTSSKAGSFTLIASLLISFIISFLYHIKKAKTFLIRKILLLTVAVLILSLSTNLVDGILKRFSEASDFNSLSTGRMDLWENAIKLVFTDFNIIHGVGMGMYAEALTQIGASHVQIAHNTYLSFFSECGVATFIFVVILVFKFFLKISKDLCENKNIMSLALFFSILSIIIEMFALNLQNSRTLYVFFMFVLAYYNHFKKYDYNSNENQS